MAIRPDKLVRSDTHFCGYGQWGLEGSRVKDVCTTTAHKTLPFSIESGVRDAKRLADLKANYKDKLLDFFTDQARYSAAVLPTNNAQS
uniref:Gluconate 2-dehydrogenase (acceptor) n=1 Tax=Steinernema glaseri TaxID=37863 RepID=A0A1I8A5Y2_9BILA